MFAKTETNEDIEVIEPAEGNDANTVLGFPSGLVYTLRLYKNNELLYKDGKPAIIISNPQYTWGATITSGDTLLIKVDGTATQTITFTNSDFIDNGTGFTTVDATNTLESWAEVFNAKVTGITASGDNGILTLTSNRGNSARASITIVGGTLVTKSMFALGTTDTGIDNDYELDRNLGQLKLQTPLVEGDSLIVATDNTRAYIETEEFPSGSVSISSSTADLWFAVDGAAEVLPTGITAATSITVSSIATNRSRYAASANTFGENTEAYIQPGDWVIIWDTQFSSNNRGHWRVSDVDNRYTLPYDTQTGNFTVGLRVTGGTSGAYGYIDADVDGGVSGTLTLRDVVGTFQNNELITDTATGSALVNGTLVNPTWSWFEVEKNNVTGETKTTTSVGVVFARTNAMLQKISVTPTTYTMTSLATKINGTVTSNRLVGATATVYRNTRVRVTTNTYGPSGDIMLVTTNIKGLELTFPTGILSTNNPSHFAAIESGNGEAGTPRFKETTTTARSTNQITLATAPSNIDLRIGDIVTFGKRKDVVGNKRYGNDKSYNGLFSNFNSTLVGNIRATVKSPEYLVTDRVYGRSPYGFSGNDNLSVIVDKDNVNKNFNINLYRQIRPRFSWHTGTFNILDWDNNELDPAIAFGSGSNATISFDDFAIYMKARGTSHYLTVATGKQVYWRYNRFGPEGERARLSYENPLAPDQDFAITTDTDDGNANIKIYLPSGAERAGLNVSGNNSFYVTSNTSYTATTGNVNRAANVVTVTLAAASVANVHTLAIGDQVYHTTTDGTFPEGPKVVTGVTANTFTYSETAADGPSGVNHIYTTSRRPAGKSQTVTALVSSGTHITATIGTHIWAVGDVVYFTPGHYDTTSTVRVAAGAKTITSIAATTITWAEATTAATATLVAGVSYRISSGICQKITLGNFKAQTAIGALSRNASDIVTATMTTTPILTSHPYVAGDIVYISPGEADFPAGPKLIISTTGTTFSYMESGATVVNTALQTFSASSTDPNFTAGGTPVVAGDIVNIGEESSLDTNVEGSHRVFSVSSTTFAFLKDDASYLGDSVPAKINATANLKFFPINSAIATGDDVAIWIDANASHIVDAWTNPNSGSNIPITEATVEEFYLTTLNDHISSSQTTSVPYWGLYDGINFVNSTSLTTGGSGSSLSKKFAASPHLLSYNDDPHEVMRLVPITAKGVADFISNHAISGLGSNATATVSSDGDKVQIVSNTIGSDGAIQVTGGTGNNATAAVHGSGEIITINSIDTYSRIMIPAGQDKGFAADIMVSVEGSDSGFKVTPFVSGTSAAIVATGDPEEWLIQLTGSGTTAVSVIQAISAGLTYRIEKQGKFMAYIDESLFATALSANIKEGDWVYIDSENMSGANTGIRQIVRIDTTNAIFWVENPDGVEETVTLAAGDFLKFITYDSVMPGDTLVIDTSLLGTANMGEFTVSRLSESGAATTATEFYVSGSLEAVAATALGVDFPLFKIKEANPIRLIKKIRAIHINADPDYYDVVFTTPSYGSKISSTVGSVMTALDKLEFDTSSAVVGLNGYSHNTGLLAEVNKVIYGDETNSSIYPGIVASGANVNISGPLSKRITVSLAVRLRTGVSAAEIVDRVQNAVAAEINSKDVGESIAISDIVAVANNIDGVLAVTVLSPTYSSGNDLISIQPNEKPRVLDIEQDVLVTIVS